MTMSLRLAVPAATIAALSGPLAAQGASASGSAPSCPRARCGTRAFSICVRSGANLTGGTVQVTIYSGGVLGDEPEMVRQIRQGRIQAVGLSSVGLSRIDNGVSCLQVPMMFRSYDELDYVRDRVAPTLERRIEAKGFKVLNWADGGWVHTFTKRPARTPDDVRRMKLFTSAGDPETERLYKDFGFQVVPLSLTDMVTSLQTGMIDAFSTVPLFAQLQESYKLAPHMIDVLWMPLVGGTVISQKTWDQIPGGLSDADARGGARRRAPGCAPTFARWAMTRSAKWRSADCRSLPWMPRRASYGSRARSARIRSCAARTVRPSSSTRWCGCGTSSGATMRAETAENAVSVAVLAAMTALALVEVGGRLTLGRGIPGRSCWFSTSPCGWPCWGPPWRPAPTGCWRSPRSQFLPSRVRAQLRVFTSTVAVAVSASLALASADLVRVERSAGDIVAWGIPSWVVLAVLPLGFAAIAVRLAWHAAAGAAAGSLAASGLAVAPRCRSRPQLSPRFWSLPGLVVVLVATGLGMPIFAAMGGAALLLFWGDGTPLNAVPGEAYRLTTSPMLPAIPLFALGGYILAEGKASQRLMRLFTALVGWMPGGLAIVVTAVLAFFTPLTGASGVTILSMGGLLLPVLVGARYPERTSIGLVTVSGSIGLLFFPSLPVFLYSFYAGVPVDRLFVAALIPGIVLVAVVAGWAASRGWRSAARTPFAWREALGAIWAAKWELLLPVVVLGGILLGATTLVEAAAMAVVYVVVIECAVHRRAQCQAGSPSRRDRVRHAPRRVPDHSQRRARPDQLPGDCRSPGAAARLGRGHALPRRSCSCSRSMSS